MGPKYQSLPNLLFYYLCSLLFNIRWKDIINSVSIISITMTHKSVIFEHHILPRNICHYLEVCFFNWNILEQKLTSFLVFCTKNKFNLIENIKFSLVIKFNPNSCQFFRSTKAAFFKFPTEQRSRHPLSCLWNIIKRKGALINYTLNFIRWARTGNLLQI